MSAASRLALRIVSMNDLDGVAGVREERTTRCMRDLGSSPGGQSVAVELQDEPVAAGVCPVHWA
jgi:hypothetical protein